MLFWSFLVFISCSFSEETPIQSPTPSSIPQKNLISVINVDDLKKLSEEQRPLIIDVRTSREYQSGHIPKARHVPLSELPDAISSIEDYKSQPIYLVCAVGGRSKRAQMMLLSHGFNAINVDGGTNEWVAKGYPVEQ